VYKVERPPSAVLRAYSVVIAKALLRAVLSFFLMQALAAGAAARGPGGDGVQEAALACTSAKYRQFLQVFAFVHAVAVT
jgi:hypothetical protein